MADKIRKRDGRVVKFERDKIANAIYKAFVATATGSRADADSLSCEVESLVDSRRMGLPGVEDVQDMVEQMLIKRGFPAAAKAYILYRQERTRIREAKKFFGVTDELKLTVNAVRVLERRYLLKNDEGAVAETPAGMFRRVAKAIARDASREDEFYSSMAALEFIPNSPTLMNAGTDLGQLSACFVIPVGDSLADIFEAVKDMALIQQSGGGTGFAFSRLRPRGDIVRSTKGVASGPVSFMRVFDVTTDVIKQGGRRRGANMGILRVRHPDIIDFITIKSKGNNLSNFNLSVAVDDRFMDAVEHDSDYELINPRSGAVAKKVRARDVWNLIVTMAWRTGDPGVVFIDEINRYNPTPQLGEIESTNPCGEQPLLPYESCNLGSINLGRMVRDGELDTDKLTGVVRLGVEFLDSVIDINRYPLPDIERMTKGNRKIGLGVMGFADMLVQLNIPYDSEEGIAAGEKVMKLIAEEANKASVELGEALGVYPNFDASPLREKRRNSTVTTVAPTGTISIIAGCSSGIEPIFAVSYFRNVLEGTKLIEVNPYFEKSAKERGFYSQELMMNIAKTGSIRDIAGIPDDVKRTFVTAFDISPQWHVRMQAAFQKYTDNAVSKTINLPHDATVNDVEQAYMLAYRSKCKGVTVYRYGSKDDQVLYLSGLALGEMKYVSADAEYAGGCPAPTCTY